ncbi:MAG: BamA/TamA family outer membrane protein [Gracilimonas sp.]
MPHKLFLFLLFIGFPFLAQAQSNNHDFHIFELGKEIELPDSIQSKIASDFNSAEETLLQWFAKDGFLNAEINTPSPQKAEITRGCQFSLNQINITYSGAIDSSFTQNTGIKYTQKILEDRISALVFDLVEKGYPFAKSEIIQFKPDNGNCSVTVDLGIETGERARTSNIYFSGARSNSQGYLQKISRFRAGQNITPNYIRYLRTNLNSSELFNSVGKGQVFLREGEPVIVFDVEERSLNQFDGLLGYVPDAAGNGQIVGDVQLSLWNVVTQGNGFNFQYQRLRPEVSELDLGVSQDWIGNIPVGISAGFQLYQNDTTYQSRDFELGGYYRITGGFKLTGGVGFQATTSGANVPVIVEPDGRKRTARLGFDYINLDNLDVPTKGSRLNVSLGIANKDLEEDSAGSFIQNTLHFQANNYIPIFQQSVIATSLNGFLLESDKVTINDLIRFGGANSLRGYAEDQFRAGTMLWGDIEYRFLLNRSSFLFAFGAAGGYHRPKLLTETTSNFQTTDYLFSTGFGLSYQTRIGRLKFTYAISPEESIGNGKVHFGIRTEL